MKIDKITTKKRKTIFFDEASNIRVYENRHYRWLQFGNVVQSLMLKRNPALLCMLYQKMLASVHVHFSPKVILECGLGGGNMVRFIAEQFASANITSTESSAAIIDIFNLYFQPSKTNLCIEYSQAVDTINRTKNHSVDWLIMDIYQPDRSNIFSKTLIELINKKLNNNAWLSINLPDLTESELIEQLKILRTVFFDNIWLATVPGCQNIIVHARKCNLTSNSVFNNSEHVSPISSTHRLWRLFKQVC